MARWKDELISELYFQMYNTVSPVSATKCYSTQSFVNEGTLTVIYLVFSEYGMKTRKF